MRKKKNCARGLTELEGRRKMEVALRYTMPDMEFVQNFTLPDFQAKTFTPLTSPNFNSFSDKIQKMGKNREIITLAKILHCHRQ